MAEILGGLRVDAGRQRRAPPGAQRQEDRAAAAGRGVSEILGELEKQQEVLAGISDVVMEAFAMESVLSAGARSMRRRKSELICSVLLRDAMARIEVCRAHGAGGLLRRRCAADQYGRACGGLPSIEPVNAIGLRQRICREMLEAGWRLLCCWSVFLVRENRRGLCNRDGSAFFRCDPSLLSDDVTNQTIHARVFATLRYLLRQRLAIGRPVTYIDATHLTRGERKPYLEIARWHRCAIEAVYFDVPLNLCVERNRARGRNVPEDALIAMAARLEPPAVEEGFSQVIRL